MTGGRKLVLTIHITCSVAWFGAITAFLVLAVAGLGAGDGNTARGLYMSMQLIATTALVPFGIAAFASGLIESLATPWGLVRHYWVIVKLLLTLVCLGLLLLHARVITFLASVAGDPGSSLNAYPALRAQLVVDSSAALAALAVTIVLAVYKPRGTTAYGWRRAQTRRT
jgi:hypothetical protein